VSNDGLVAAGGADGTVTVWQLPDGQQLATLPSARSRPGDQLVGTTILQLQFDPEGKRLAVARADGKVILWNPRSRWGLTEFQGHRREVRSLAFSPDGAMLASADVHGRIVLWNVAPSQQAMMKAVLRDGDQGFAVARLAPDGSWIATGGTDKTVILWDASTGRRRAMLLGHTSPVKALTFSKNGALLASASQREVITWDIASGKRLRTFEGASALALSASGDKLAATVENGIVAIWNAAGRIRKSTIRMLPGQPTALAFSPDGGTLAITSENQVKLWSASTSNGRERTTLQGYQGGKFATVAFSSDGKTLASTGEQGSINFWHSFTGRRLFAFRGLNGNAIDLTFSPSGKRLAAVTTRSQVHIWISPSEVEVQSKSGWSSGR
jgi:WD40 repeat protein